MNINWDLRFTLSKIFAFLLLILGSATAMVLRDASIMGYVVPSSAGLFAVKTYTESH